MDASNAPSPYDALRDQYERGTWSRPSWYIDEVGGSSLPAGTINVTNPLIKPEEIRSALIAAAVFALIIWLKK